MIHRAIYSVLKTGIEAITAKPAYLDDLFDRDYELENAEISTIKAYYARKPPTVINGYARIDSPFPLFSIVLGSEGEVKNVLGDAAHDVLDDDDELYGADVETAIWEHAYNIFILTEHPDVTAYYYEIAKYIMVAALQTLTNTYDLFEYRLSGSELAPDPAYLPEHLHARQLTFKCQSEFQRIDRTSLLSKAFQVAGIHVDNVGSSSDVGGVKTLVTTYTVEE